MQKRPEQHATVLQTKVVNHIAIALTEVRGIVEGSNRQSVLMDDATKLFESVRAMTVTDGEIEYLCQVNSLVQWYFQLWQEKQVDLVVGNSILARLLPEVVAKLTAWNQERTLQYFNNIVRTFQSADAANHMPAKFRARFFEALRQYTSASPASASYRGLCLSDDSVGVEAYERMGRFERNFNPAASIISTVSDLHFVAPARGLLHWSLRRRVCIFNLIIDIIFDFDVRFVEVKYFII